MADLGMTFTPGLSRRFTATLNGQSPLTPGQSQALQVLALRLPGFLGGATPAPEALLRGSVGGLRPDAAVRAQVAPAPAAVNAPAEQAPVSAPPPSPLSSPDAVSPMQGYASLFGGPSNPFGGYTRDVGPSSNSGTPGGTNFTFNRPPRTGGGYDDGSVNVPLPPAYGGPGQPAGPPSAEPYAPSGGMNGLLDGVFGGGGRRFGGY